MKKLFALIAALALAANAARADDEWSKIGEYQAIGRGDAKEVRVDKKIARARIVCTEGSIIINTLVVRADGKTEPRKVGSRISKGEKFVIDVVDGKGDKKKHVDGFRISDDGKGSYKVEVLH